MRRSFKEKVKVILPQLRGRHQAQFRQHHRRRHNQHPPLHPNHIIFLLIPSSLLTNSVSTSTFAACSYVRLGSTYADAAAHFQEVSGRCSPSCYYCCFLFEVAVNWRVPPLPRLLDLFSLLYVVCGILAAECLLLLLNATRHDIHHLMCDRRWLHLLLSAATVFSYCLLLLRLRVIADNCQCTSAELWW